MSVSLFHGVRWTPFFCCCAWLLLAPLAHAQGQGIVTAKVEQTSYEQGREALVEAIEGQGLVISHTSAFATMLARTGKDLGQTQAIYDEAETLHFCSAKAAWLLAAESPANVALCPLGIAIYTLAQKPGTVYFAYRSPGRRTAGERFGHQLLQDILQKAAALAHP